MLTPFYVVKTSPLQKDGGQALPLSLARLAPQGGAGKERVARRVG